MERGRIQGVPAVLPSRGPAMQHDDLPDFDTLARMAREDPEALEALRDRLASNLIEGARPEHRRRLRGLQFQIDMERRRAANPLASCLRISQMMQASLLDLQQALAGETHPGAQGPRRPADVIPLSEAVGD